ncbi:unnamed protein product [Nezara viridula]|uniref:C2H2-type domain-containing protein n=1 Tax=Nezara viridula TaxID=85310 RepID=A0A9P0E873_NEZVI|nr:unnamed protein product [Nezara viridula]
MCPNSGKKVICFICEISFPTKLSMLKHVSEMHQISDDINTESNSIIHQKQNDSILICNDSMNNVSLVISNNENLENQHSVLAQLSNSQCSRNLELEKNISKNIKVCHRTVHCEMKLIKCVLCDVSCRTKQFMLTHYENDHSIKIITEIVKFDNVSHFLKWKKDMEQKTVTRFVKYRNKYFKSSTKNFYRCHRDGVFKKSGRNIRQLKSHGSNKINGHCPAKLEVCHFKEKQEIFVKYTKTHVGHTMEIQKINLDTEERQFIASRLANKVPNKKILNDIRNANIGKLGRLQHVTMKDLHNIKKSLSDNEVPLETNHRILNWIKEVQDSGNSSAIKFCKPIGTIIKEFPSLTSEDFLLIVVTDRQLSKLQEFGTDIVCIDIHHDGDHTFDIVVLSVIDENKQSFPSAFMFSNVLTKGICELFFEVIKSCLGFPLKSRAVMTDIDDFFHIWCSVMLFSSLHLYSSWLLKNRWQKNAGSKIHSLVKQQLIFDKLVTLIEERNCEEFEKMLSEICHSMEQDFELENFGHYFEYFKNNKQSWAQCYRDIADINYSLLFERLNRSIDFIYNQEKRIEYIDTVVDLLIDFVESKFLEIGDCSQEIMKRHELCLNSMAALSISENGDNTWTVSCLKKNIDEVLEDNKHFKCEFKASFLLLEVRDQNFN